VYDSFKKSECYAQPKNRLISTKINDTDRSYFLIPRSLLFCRRDLSTDPKNSNPAIKVSNLQRCASG
jgi:hypothetical protein